MVAHDRIKNGRTGQSATAAIPSRSGTASDSQTDLRLRDHQPACKGLQDTDSTMGAILENWPQDLHFRPGEGQNWSNNSLPIDEPTSGAATDNEESPAAVCGCASRWGGRSEFGDCAVGLRIHVRLENFGFRPGSRAHHQRRPSLRCDPLARRQSPKERAPCRFHRYRR